MSDMDYWIMDQIAHKWEMPVATWWKRLPVIRHFRTAWHSILVRRHNAIVRHIGMIPRGYDEWVLFGMWHGLERKP